MNGSHVDIATATIVDVGVFNTLNLHDTRPVVKPEHLYRTTVYNIEVEDFHTYYVGEVGVWVHNTKSITVKPGVGGEPLSEALASRPFYSRAELMGYLEKNQAATKNSITIIRRNLTDKEAKGVDLGSPLLPSPIVPRRIACSSCAQ